jgi:hypothetical protein
MVFHRESLYRRRGIVRSGPGPCHHMVARARGRTTPWWACLLAPLWLLFGLCPSSGKNRSFGLRFVQFQEYFLFSFSETQNNRKQGTGSVASR